jgi:succinoglycan biosynthesis protein ExoO
VAPDVSIVIAAYNAEATLGRAVGSALAQRGVEVEVIVVDDSSADGTLALARTFPPERVRVVALPENRGPGGARNAALEVARGRWIAVVDADDAIDPDRTARMLARADREQAQIVVDNLEVIAGDGAPPYAMFPTDYLAARKTLSLADFIDDNRVFESTFNFGYMKPMFERAFLAGNGLRYDEALSIGEDYLLLASALASGGRCVVEPDVGYAYHIRSGSISRVLERRHLKAMQAADRTFAERHALAGEARNAFARRSRSLQRAESFLCLVENIKSRNAVGALRTALGDPGAVRHLGMPIAKRLRGVAGQLAGLAGRMRG